MPVVIDATPGGPNANSFATLAQANTYWESRLYSSAWDLSNDDTKNRALVTATRRIVYFMDRIGWQGWPVTSTQRLPVPRSGMVTRNGWTIVNTIIPSELVEATAEYAGQMIEATTLPETPSDTEGIKSVSAGPVAIDFDTEGSSSPLELPESVFNMIAFLATEHSGRTSVPLIRS